MRCRDAGDFTGRTVRTASHREAGTIRPVKSEVEAQRRPRDALLLPFAASAGLSELESEAPWEERCWTAT